MEAQNDSTAQNSVAKNKASDQSISAMNQDKIEQNLGI